MFWLACVFVGGCQTEPAFNEEGFAVRPEPAGPLAASEPAVARTRPVRWVSRQLTVPLARPIEGAWAACDESVLPELTRAVWNANGLRLGVLRAGEAARFGEALGPAGAWDGQLLVYDYPEVLRETRPLRAEFVTDLTVPPGPTRRESFTRGRLRLLVASRPAPGGGKVVTLTPQHHRPRASLLPRSALEKRLDGRVFTELAVELDVRPGEAVLVGLYRVEPAPTEAETETSELPLDPPEPPYDLGRGLFTTGLTAADQQVLFLLRPL
ncbi:MAG: hypothetical protein AAF800_04285 [Planctomycetota bacterium]